MKPGCLDVADIGENRGLRVSCSNAGTKSFFYRYTSPVTKKLIHVHIGHFPNVSLAEARVLLRALRQLRQENRCPATEQKEAKAKAAAAIKAKADAMTVEQLVEHYLRGYIEDRYIKGKRIPGGRKKKGQSETRRTLEGDAVRVLGNMPALLITRKDVINLVMEIVDRGANVQAGNVLRELTAAYEYSIGLERFNDDFANPALLAKASLRQAKVKLTSTRRRRVLSDKELTQFLKWLPGSFFTPTQKNILRFTLWTGCRTGEICTAEWNDVDLKAGVWHLRDTKTGVERYVQLPSQAIDFLKQLKLTTGVYLFPSQKTGLAIQQKSLTEQAWLLRKTNRMVDIDHWVPHDLRRTVRTGLSRLQCPNEVAEAILGHSRSGIEGTYDLHKYEKESKLWIQQWANHIQELL